MGKADGAGAGAGAGATAVKNKKKGRPSLLDLHKRALEQQQLQRRSTRRIPNSTSADAGEDEYYDEDDDDERKQKKVKLVVRLPQSDKQQHLSSDLIRSSSVNSASCGSDSNADVDNCKVKSGSGGVVADHQGEKVLKVMDALHGSPLQSGPATPLPDKKLLVFILDRLQKKDTHAVFSDPVDPNELPDYFEVIKRPMDFGTVRSKLDEGLYSNLEELEADVYLICSNAMQYNSSDTVFFRQARSIQELAKRDFENLRQEGEDGELQPKVVRRGRPPGKQQVKKTPGRPPLDRVGPESTSGATLATTEDNTNESIPYNLRKAPPMLYRFQADGGSHRSRNGEHYSELLSDWNGEFPERIKKADMKYGNKNLIIDETRRDTYKQFHPSAYAYDSSLFSNFGGDRKQLLAVGLHAEHGYARSLARFSANLGPVVWKIASKKIEKAVPPGTKFSPGLVGENDPSPPPSSFFLPGNPRPMSCLVPDSIPNRPQTPSTSGQNPKVEIIEPDSGIRTGSPSHHDRNGFNSVFRSTTAVENERVCEVNVGPVKPTSWQQVSSSNLSPAPPDINCGDGK